MTSEFFEDERTYDDSPIEDFSEDQLKTGAFSKGLASSLKNWHSERSLVVGLQGQWGQGKSSIKNMCLREIAETMYVIQYNPWHFPKEGTILMSFFNQIVTDLDLLLKVERKIGEGELLATEAEEMAKYAAMLVGFSALIPAVVGSDGEHDAQAKVIGGLLKGAVPFWQYITSRMQKKANEKQNEPARSIFQQKLYVNEKLKSLKKRVLIVIDDIDRLTPLEIQEVLQLVKSTADFYNVTYLLIFDREVVEHGLAQLVKVRARDFLQKIVQVEIVAPAIDLDFVHEKLNTALTKKLQAMAPDLWDQKRWNRIAPLFSQGLLNIRMVKRYLNSFCFHCSLFEGEDGAEVNPADLALLELLRFIAPQLVNAMPARRDFFAPEAYQLEFTKRKDSDEKKLLREEALNLIDRDPRLSTEQKNLCQAILCEMFPAFAILVEREGGIVPDSERAELQQLRISHPYNYLTYFVTLTPAGYVSRAEVKSLLDASASYDEMVALLMGSNSADYLQASLSYLSRYQERIPQQNWSNYMAAIFEASEHSKIDIVFNMGIDGMPERLLKQVSSKTLRGQVFRNALSQSKAIYWPSIVIGLENRKKVAKSTSHSAESLFTMRDQATFKIEVLRRIKELVASEELIEHPHLGRLLIVWLDLGSKTDCKDWVRKKIQVPSDSLKILKSALNTVYGNTGTRKEGDVRYLLQFVRISLIEKAVSISKTVATSASDWEAIEAFEFTFKENDRFERSRTTPKLAKKKPETVRKKVQGQVKHKP